MKGFWANLHEGYTDVQDIFSVSKTALLEHILTLICAIWFFSTLFSITYYLLKYIIKPDFFTQKKTREDRYLQAVLIVANIHHVIVGSCVMYTLLYMCDRPFAFFWGDEMCLRTYKPFYSHLCMVTVGYFAYDLIAQVLLYRDFSPLGVQNIAHHLISFACFGCSLLGGYNFAMIAHITMICEVSQVFNNIRGLIGK